MATFGLWVGLGLGRDIIQLGLSILPRRTQSAVNKQVNGMIAFGSSLFRLFVDAISNCSDGLIGQVRL